MRLVCERDHTDSLAESCASRRHLRPIVGGVTVPPVKKLRIDAALAERGLFPSRTAAAGAVRAGEVRIGADGPIAIRPSELVGPEAELIVAERPRFVSRGGIKLANALDALGIDVAGARLPRRRRLHRGLHGLPAAARRCAGDRARRRPRPARLAASRRSRVTVIERCNARELDPASLPFRPELADRRRLLHLPGQGAAGGRRAWPRRRDPGAGQAAVRAGPRAGRRGRRGPQPRRSPRRDSLRSRRPRTASACGSRASPPPGCRAPRATCETFVWCGPSARAARRPRGRRSRGRAVSATEAERPQPAAESRARHPLAPAAHLGGRGGRDHGRARGRGRAGHDRRRRPRSTARRPRASRSPRSCPSVPTSAWCSAATARSSGPCGATRAPVCRCSASTSARSASSPRSSADQIEEGLERAFAGSFEAIELPGLEVDAAGRRNRPERRHLQPPAARPRRRAELRDRRRGGRERPLRRAGGRNPGRVDRLQPRQQRPDPRLGRRGLRGQLHRAAHADGAGAGRRPRRRASGRQRNRPRPGRHRRRRRAGGRACSRRGDRGSVPRRRRRRLAQIPGSSFYHRIREKFGHLAV